MCVCVGSGVFPASNLCFGFFNFSPIWGGQVGQCLLHDAGSLCQKGICTVDHSKYVYEYGYSMVQTECWGGFI